VKAVESTSTDGLDEGANTTNGDSLENGDHGADDDDELTRRIAMEAANLDTVDVDDDDWAQDTSAEAVARRLKDLSVGGAVAKLNGADEGEGDEDGDCEFLNTFFTLSIQSSHVRFSLTYMH
jgi:translation initiation factor 5